MIKKKKFMSVDVRVCARARDTYGRVLLDGDRNAHACIRRARARAHALTIAAC